MFDSRLVTRTCGNRLRPSLCEAAGIAPGAKPDGLLQGAFAVVAGQGIAEPGVGIQLIGDDDLRLVRGSRIVQE